MTLSSLSSTRSPSLATQEASLPSPGHTGTAADTLQPPPHLPVPRRTAQTGPSAPTRLRAVLPPGPSTADVSAPPPVRQDAPSADPAIAMTLARAEKIANEADYGERLALASGHFAELFKCTLDTYAAAQACHTQWLDSGDETHQASAQTLTIKAALLNGLYLMRRHHKEWNLDTPVISVKTLKNVLPLFRHALGLCKDQSDAVRFPIEGLNPALKYLQKQAAQSRQCLAATPACDAGQLADCRELASVAQQLETMLAQGPDSRRTEPAPGTPPAATPSSPWRRSFKSVLTEVVPVRPEPTPGQGGPPPANPSAPRQVPPNAKASRELRPVMPRMETLQPQDRPAPVAKPKPHHLGAADRWATQPAKPPTQPPAAHFRGRQPTSGTRQGVAAERPADAATAASAAAATAARLRQEQLARLRGALAPLQDEADRLHDIAQACASTPTPAGPAWARHASEFAAWQHTAQANDACAKALAAHVKELSFGPRDPAVHGLRRKFNTASRVALESATQAAESALATYLQAWEAAPGQAGLKRAGLAELAAQGRELQQQWLDAPLRPRMPVLSARMAAIDACEAFSDVMARDVKAGGRAAAHEAAELLCQATADARQASEGARGDLRNRLSTLHTSCKNLRDELLCKTTRLEFEAADAAHAGAHTVLQPLLHRSREAAATGDLLLLGDPLPATGPGGPGAHTPPAHGPVAIPEPDRGLFDTARQVVGGLRAQREQAIQLPPDAPEQAAHDQQAVLSVLRQADLTAEAAAATLTSFHNLKGALARMPLDERPTLMRSHAKAMRDRAQDLQQILLAQEDMPDKILDAMVGALVARSCAQLRQDLRHVQTVFASLETLAKLLDARVSADHACRRMAQGNHVTPGPDVDGSTHLAIAIWAKEALRSIEQTLQLEQNGLETEAWKEEKGRLDKTGDGLRLRIECDAALIRGKHFLQAVAIFAPATGTVPLHQLDNVAEIAQQSAKLSVALARVNEDLEKRATPSTGEAGYRAQIDMNKAVRHHLRTAQRQLLSTLMDLRARSLADTSAGSSSQAEGPAAQAPRAPQKGQPPQPSRRNRHR